MHIQFLRKIEELGFTDSGERFPGYPAFRIYDAPARLRGAISSLNIGSSPDFCTFQEPGPGYRELGGMFALTRMDDDLLVALALEPEGFLRWHRDRVGFSFSFARVSGEVVEGITTTSGEAVVAPRNVQ